MELVECCVRNMVETVMFMYEYKVGLCSSRLKRRLVLVLLYGIFSFFGTK